MFFQIKFISQFLIILILFNLTISNYVAMEEQMERIFKEYLTYSFAGNLLPNRRMKKVS